MTPPIMRSILEVFSMLSIPLVGSSPILKESTIAPSKKTKEGRPKPHKIALAIPIQRNVLSLKSAKWKISVPKLIYSLGVKIFESSILFLT